MMAALITISMSASVLGLILWLYQYEEVKRLNYRLDYLITLQSGDKENHKEFDEVCI